MLEVLGPGLVIVVSACCALLVLGLVYSFYAYFIPYLQQKRKRLQPTLPTATVTDHIAHAELQRSLYGLPDLLHSIPRSTLAECEILSGRWASGILDYAALRSAASRSPSPIRQTSYTSMNRLRCPRPATRRALRESLLTSVSLAISVENESRSTLITDDDEETGRVSKVTEIVRRPQSLDGSTQRVKCCQQYKRRNSAPAHVELRRSIMSDRSMTTILTPSNTIFSLHSKNTSQTSSTVPSELIRISSGLVHIAEHNQKKISVESVAGSIHDSRGKLYTQREALQQV